MPYSRALPGCRHSNTCRRSTGSRHREVVVRVGFPDDTPISLLHDELVLYVSPWSQIDYSGP
jgi:hypothetical protein